MTGDEPGAGLFFLRHGQTTANRDGLRSGGECDPPLTRLGREQARDTGVRLRMLGVAPGLIVSSPLSRTLETAAILNAGMNLEMKVEPALIERRLGDWNGRSVEATQSLLASGATPPGGESDAAFRTRALSAFRDMAPLYARWPLIVSSSGVARILIERAGRGAVYGLPNGSVLRVSLADPEAFEIADLRRLHPSPEDRRGEGDEARRARLG